MAAFSIIFTLAGLCIGSIEARKSKPCTPAQQFLDSVNFQQCKEEAFGKLSEMQIPHMENLHFKKPSTTHSFCDYLDDLQSRCFPLYSSCYPDLALQVMLGVWIRQELKNSLSVPPRNQFFHCNATKDILHEKELGAMKDMVKVKDWFANSRHCKYLLSYAVEEPPNYLMNSMLRCDGKCDPEDQLEIPFRVSPAISNPPREYRKKVRVVDFKNEAYLNTAMNNTIDKYQRCLTSIGYPANIPQYIKGIPIDNKETSQEASSFQSVEIKHRSCLVLTTFIEECLPILTKCLSTSNAEIIRAKDSLWVVTQVRVVVKDMKDNHEAFEFDHTECEVLGGEVSGAVLAGLARIILVIALSLNI
eukprot:GFUD01056701.1.p1 GENE.GFUD01056701.1~~GFUD01056701.1.p1  ORF type:complete len:367 (-),score=55.25 GFUD01056701.1:21-1100(-)